jgi:hypothetical protein
MLDNVIGVELKNVSLGGMAYHSLASETVTFQLLLYTLFIKNYKKITKALT